MSRTEKKAAKRPKAKSDSGPNRSNIIIGLTGPFGSGCGAMREILEEDFGFKPFKISEDIREELKKSR
jgi:hypothetical protein